MAENFTELAFTNDVISQQEKYGTRKPYEKMAAKGEFRNKLTWQEKSFIQDRDSFYMSSVGKNDWPYVQFRGGPAGFLKQIDETTLAYGDFKGNGQYITTGNFINNNKTVLFLMDYPNQKRLKVWATSTVYEAQDKPELAEKVFLPDYKGSVERIIVFNVEAFDWNCPQHITPKYTMAEIELLGLNK